MSNADLVKQYIHVRYLACGVTNIVGPFQTPRVMRSV